MKRKTKFSSQNNLLTFSSSHPLPGQNFLSGKYIVTNLNILIGTLYIKFHVIIISMLIGRLCITWAEVSALTMCTRLKLGLYKFVYFNYSDNNHTGMVLVNTTVAQTVKPLQMFTGCWTSTTFWVVLVSSYLFIYLFSSKCKPLLTPFFVQSHYLSWWWSTTGI